MKVLLADDHRLVIEGVRAALAGVEDVEVVGEAVNGAQVLPLVSRLRPDVVLLDVRLPQVDGFACLQMLRQRFPEVKVVMLSVFCDQERIQAALQRGACGYIVKSINPRDLASALRQAVEGDVYLAAGLSEEDGEAGARDAGLTEREITIVRAAARGLSNRAIGRELWVTEQTVKFHLTNIYRKLGVGNRTEAARAAFALGLVENPIVGGEPAASELVPA